MSKLRELYKKEKEYRARTNELADILAQRELTDDENAELRELNRKIEETSIRIRNFQFPAETPENSVDYKKQLRDAVSSNKKFDIVLAREAPTPTPAPGATGMTTTDVAAGGMVKVTTAEVLKALRAGLIFDKVGLDLRSGLSGEYVWPVASAMTAQIAGEAVKLTDQKISLSKLTAKPVRLGITAYMTNQSILQSDGVVEAVVREELPKSIADLINKATFSPTALDGGTDIKGPFVSAAKVSFAGKVPTLAELNKLRAKVLAKGHTLNHAGFVMSFAMKATLECTPVDAGSGIMVCANDKILGVPVFATNEIGEGNIGFGDFSQHMVGLFGTVRFVADPYTEASSDIYRLTMNVNYGSCTLRQDAFVLGQASAS